MVTTVRTFDLGAQLRLPGRAHHEDARLSATANEGPVYLVRPRLRRAKQQALPFSIGAGEWLHNRNRLPLG
jgi:hypothetical protein